MSSDSEFAKKLLEREALEPFLKAYAVATGATLTLAESGENPDFICLRPDETRIGVELTEITRAPVDKHFDRVFLRQEELSPFDAQALIYKQLCRKEEARANRYVQRVPRNMLVLQLTDASLSHIRPALDGLESEFTDHGFEEVWIADYSTLDAYGTLDLYALFPMALWGYYGRHNADSKPYG